jgi:urease accessory protein
VTRIRLGRDARGRARVDLHAEASDHLVARLLAQGEGRARVALVGIGALLLAGDHVRIEVEVEAGLALEIVEVAGTVAYDARGGAPATWEVRVGLGRDARLRWDAEPFVVADGARVRRHSDVELAVGAVAVLREQLVLGRVGEVGGDLLTSTRVTHDGRPLLVEELDLARAHRDDPTQLGGARVLDTLLVLGARAAWERAPGREVHQLEGPGTMARSLVGETHASAVAQLAQLAAGTAPGVDLAGVLSRLCR